MDRAMIGVSTPSGTIISPTLISPERYALLYAAHSQRARPEAFTYDLLKLLAMYHPRAKALNPQVRKIKLVNHRATPPTLQQALERTVLNTPDPQLLHVLRYVILLGLPGGRNFRCNQRFVSIPLDWLMCSQPGL